jgi:hypothetical protein
MPNPIPWNSRGQRVIRTMFSNIKLQASSCFYYPNEAEASILDFVLLPAISIHWKSQNPLWCQLIGAPGSGKTAHICLLDLWDGSVFLSRLTKNSLISGFRSDARPDYDPSLLNMLDSKVLIVKDFTCILQGPREERDSVVGQLRDIFDGKASRHLGNIGLKEYVAHFNMLLAVTPIIDGFHSVTSQLGERFITRRELTLHRRKITMAAFDNMFTGDNERKLADLKAAVRDFINSIPRISISSVVWPTEFKKRIISGADLIAACRSHVLREHSSQAIASCPNPEVGTRLVTQLAQAVVGYCLLNGISEVNEEAWKFGGARLLRDTLPAVVAWVLQCLYFLQREQEDKGGIQLLTLKELLPITRLGWSTTNQVVTDLYLNGVLQAEYTGSKGRRGTYYFFKEAMLNRIKRLGLFDQPIEMTQTQLSGILKNRERVFAARSRKPSKGELLSPC